jgi:hypothetical protein
VAEVSEVVRDAVLTLSLDQPPVLRLLQSGIDHRVAQIAEDSGAVVDVVPFRLRVSTVRLSQPTSARSTLSTFSITTGEGTGASTCGLRARLQ